MRAVRASFVQSSQWPLGAKVCKHRPAHMPVFQRTERGPERGECWPGVWARCREGCWGSMVWFWLDLPASHLGRRAWWMGVGVACPPPPKKKGCQWRGFIRLAKDCPLL